MYPLLESIRIEDGRAQLLPYHQARMQASATALWGSTADALQTRLQQIELPTQGLYKCRVLYHAEGIQQIQLLPYRQKDIQSLRLISNNTLRYPHKSANRGAIDRLYAQRHEQDDIVIVQHGLITDSSYCNVAMLHHNGQWHTPHKALLPGVMRQHLIDSGIVKTADISLSTLQQYSKIRLFNAMMPWDRCSEISSKNIVR